MLASFLLATERKSDEKKGSLRWLVLCLIAFAAMGGIGVMDSAVFFPIVNGGGLVLTTLAALLIFKERLTKKQWIGVACGIVSVVFLCNPF